MAIGQKIAGGGIKLFSIKLQLPGAFIRILQRSVCMNECRCSSMQVNAHPDGSSVAGQRQSVAKSIGEHASHINVILNNNVQSCIIDCFYQLLSSGHKRDIWGRQEQLLQSI